MLVFERTCAQADASASSLAGRSVASPFDVSYLSVDIEGDTDYEEGELLDRAPQSKGAGPTARRLCRRCARKRGMGWNLAEADMVTLAQSIKWFYNWGATLTPERLAASERLGVPYVPQAWGRWWPNLDTIADNFPVYSNGSRPTALIGFNEPNHQLQSNIAPDVAASLWPKVEAAAARWGMVLTSPAVAPCGAQCVERDPIVWLDKFFEACKRNPSGGCKVDIIAAHYYVGWGGSSCEPTSLPWYIDKYRKYNRPIWLKEYGCMTNGGWPYYYLRAALDYLDFETLVERHAWWAPRFKVGPDHAEGSLLMPDAPGSTPAGHLWTKYGIKRDYTRRIWRKPNVRPGSTGRGVRSGAAGRLIAKAGSLRSAADWDAFCAPCLSKSLTLDYAAREAPMAAIARAAGNATGAAAAQEQWDVAHARCGVCGYGPSVSPVPEEAAQAAAEHGQGAGASGNAGAGNASDAGGSSNGAGRPAKMPKTGKDGTAEQEREGDKGASG